MPNKSFFGPIVCHKSLSKTLYYRHEKGTVIIEFWTLQSIHRDTFYGPQDHICDAFHGVNHLMFNNNYIHIPLSFGSCVILGGSVT